MREKLRNKWVWTSAISLLILILKRYGVFDADIELINVISEGILTILVVIGILNNPDGKGLNE
jgi:uncharacterized membrane protein